MHRESLSRPPFPHPPLHTRSGPALPSRLRSASLTAGATPSAPHVLSPLAAEAALGHTVPGAPCSGRVSVSALLRLPARSRGCSRLSRAFLGAARRAPLGATHSGHPEPTPACAPHLHEASRQAFAPQPPGPEPPKASEIRPFPSGASSLHLGSFAIVLLYRWFSEICARFREITSQPAPSLKECTSPGETLPAASCSTAAVAFTFTAILA